MKSPGRRPHLEHIDIESVPRKETGTAMNGDSTLVLTIEEAARRLGIGRTLMYALVMSGEVESVTIGRLRRVPLECLTEYISRLRDTSRSTPIAA